MKFNLFLLFLTTLITVALSNEIRIVRIQSVTTGEFWQSRPFSDKVTLGQIPSLWRLEKFDSPSQGIRISPLSFPPNRKVQCNGIGNPLTVNEDDGQPHQSWELPFPPPPPFIPITMLCMQKSPEPEFAVPGDGIVVTEPNNRPQWRIHEGILPDK